MVRKHTYEFIKQEFEDKNFKLISLSYKDCESKLDFICHNKHYGSVSYRSFKQNNGRCCECKYEKVATKLKYKYEFVKEIFEKENYKLLSSTYKQTHEKLEYICNKKHTNFMSFNNFLKGRRCPKCRNKTEDKFYKYFNKTFNYLTIKQQVKFDWCKNKFHLPFDFIITELNLLIEIDGEQHFRQVGKWTSPEIIRNRDIKKMNLALEKGYSILRIPQEWIFYNTNKWEDLFEYTISIMQNDSNVLLIYKDSKDLYENHIKDFQKFIEYI